MSAPSAPPARSIEISGYDTADLTPAEIEQVLTSRHSAMLSFVDKAGYPRLLPCWFHWDGTAFYTTSDPTKFHVRCLVRDSRAAMCVEAVEGTLPAQPGGRRWHGQVKGFGDIEMFGDPNGEVGLLIRRRYLEARETAAPMAPQSLKDRLVAADLENAEPDERLVLRLEPKRLSAHGGGMRFAATPNGFKAEK